MKRRNIFAALALGTVLAAGIGTAAAFDGSRCGPGAAPWGGPGMLGAAYRLDDLTAEQRTQLDALRDKVRAQMDQSRADRRALRDALRDGADVDAIRPLAEKQGQHVTAMILQQVETRTALNTILTDAQRAKLKDTARYKSRRFPHHGRGPGFGW